MAARLGCFLGRLPTTPLRGFAVQNCRYLSSSPAVWKNNTSAPKPEVPAPKPSGRGGLTGFLEEKTGVTGAWTLGVGVGAYLISKELYVLNSETVVAVVMGGVIIFLMKRLGKDVADFLDSKSQAVHDLLSGERNHRRENLERGIADAAMVEKELELRHDFFDIMKENNAMRLEEEYRRRLHEVNTAVKRRLDYQVDVEHAQKKFQQEHMVRWLETAVTELVKGKQDESLAQCMNDLKKMAA